MSGAREGLVTVEILLKEAIPPSRGPRLVKKLLFKRLRSRIVVKYTLKGTLNSYEVIKNKRLDTFNSGFIG